MMTTVRQEPINQACGLENWSYTEAFCRHRGLFTEQEQERLKCSRVAIAGLGGVGGIHLATLARLGIGAFHLADPDHFELPNFNRQYGACMHTIGRAKVEVMAEIAQTINPAVELRAFPEAVTAANVSEFLKGVDILVDGIDSFAINARRLVFREARRRGIWAVTAGPLGFSTAWLAFAPTGMSFDDYFDLHDSMSLLDQLVAFVVGIAPQATHRGYLNLSQMNPEARWGPSTALACHLASGVAAAQVLKVLLRRAPPQAAPWYYQFDPYEEVFRKAKLRWGNRHPWQRFKRWLVQRQLRGLGWDKVFGNGKE